MPEEHAIRSIDIDQGPVRPGARPRISTRATPRGERGAAWPRAARRPRRRRAGAVRMNVVVVVMDSLRADHLRQPRAHRELGQGGPAGGALPERLSRGMPTIPARRAIMSGKRTFPFRGWRPRWHDLRTQPGWEPVGSDGEMWTATLGKAGWTTGYVTDNPHLLLPVTGASGRRSTAWSWWRAGAGAAPAAPPAVGASSPLPAEGAAGHGQSGGWRTTWR